MCVTELDLIIRTAFQEQLTHQNQAHVQGHLKIQQNDGKSFPSFPLSLIKNSDFFLSFLFSFGQTDAWMKGEVITKNKCFWLLDFFSMNLRE